MASALSDPGGKRRSLSGHCEVGARLVEPSLGARVAALVEGHVPAKRYLVAVDPGYSALWSADSVRTLAIQGGALSPEEITAWEARPHWRESVELRRADDRAKTPGRVVPALEYWIPRLQAVAAGR